jgi:hypothetical protein
MINVTLHHAKLDVRTVYFFPGGFRLAGGIVALAGLAFIAVVPAIAVTLLLGGLAIVITHYRLSVDRQRKVYRDYVWFFGLKSSKPVPFDNIEYFFIKNGRETQNMQLRVARTTISKDVYDGYLKFSEADKVHVATTDTHQSLVAKLQPWAATLGVPLNDYSGQ